jgi:hypothetical protein
MLGQLVTFLLVMMNPTAEHECRAFPVDYDVAECDGLDDHLHALGANLYDRPAFIKGACDQY